MPEKMKPESLIRNKISEDQLQKALTEIVNSYDDADADFFRRCWSRGMGEYRERLKAINFIDMDRVLDAGCGFGQWLAPLSEANNHVYGIDPAENRLNVVRDLVSKLDLKNVTLHKNEITDPYFEQDSFDGIFCYSVVFLTDYRQTLTELYRIMKPKGTLYFTANGLGWYIYCLMSEHNKSSDYDPRKMALDAIEHSLSYFSGGRYQSGKQLIISQEQIYNDLRGIGFKDIRISPEGTLSLNPKIEPKTFYNQDFSKLEGVYEVLCSK